MKSSRMSSMRVICEKIRTRLCWDWSFGNNLDNNTSLPVFSQRCGPSMKGGPGSAPSKR